MANFFAIPEEERGKKMIHHKGGVTYFTKRAERLVFFFLTLGMLAWGLVDKFFE
ncbi:hypothetical protein [Desulfocurvus sp. DL9XJH121]